MWWSEGRGELSGAILSVHWQATESAKWKRNERCGHQAFCPRRVLSLNTRIRIRIVGEPTYLSEIDQEFEEKII